MNSPTVFGAAHVDLKRTLVAAVLVTTAAAADAACEPLDTAALRLQPAVSHFAFVAMDVRNGKCWQTQEEDVVSRHPPWSTFKIPHLLIALETKAVLSANDLVAWNAARRPAASVHTPQAVSAGAKAHASAPSATNIWAPRAKGPMPKRRASAGPSSVPVK